MNNRCCSCGESKSLNNENDCSQCIRAKKEGFIHYKEEENMLERIKYLTPFKPRTKDILLAKIRKLELKREKSTQTENNTKLHEEFLSYLRQNVRDSKVIIV